MKATNSQELRDNLRNETTAQEIAAAMNFDIFHYVVVINAASAIGVVPADIAQILLTSTLVLQIEVENLRKQIVQLTGLKK